MDIRDRVKMLREHLELSQAEFGARLSLERSAISLIERRQRNITERTIKDICREFNVSYAWLVDGVGEMFLDEDLSTTAAFDRIMAGEDETAKALFRAFAKLDDAEWKLLKKIIDDIQENLQKK